MKLLVAYGTKEGQTRKIARRIADDVAALGHAVELLSLQDTEGLALDRFDRILLAAPLHAGHFPKSLTAFCASHAGALSKARSAFLCVSLAAAGHDGEDWRGLDKVMADFEEATGWHPSHLLHVAGAYKPSEYDLLTRLIMRRIIAKKDPDAAPSEDKEYTDWAALEAWVSDWLGAPAT